RVPSTGLIFCHGWPVSTNWPSTKLRRTRLLIGRLPRRAEVPAHCPAAWPYRSTAHLVASYACRAYPHVCSDRGRLGSRLGERLFYEHCPIAFLTGQGAQRTDLALLAEHGAVLLVQGGAIQFDVDSAVGCRNDDWLAGIHHDQLGWNDLVHL